MAAKGGLVADITPGDCIELLDCCRTGVRRRHPGQPVQPVLLPAPAAAGAFPPGAPATVRMFSVKFPGQLTVEQLVDRYDLACRPVRDLLVDYLRERQPGIDYSSLNGLAITLAKRFWKDLEDHHPGISSLHLPPDVAAAWKQRIQTRTVRTPDGAEQQVVRQAASDALMSVRALLPRPRPVGPGRPRPLGAVGGALPHPRQRHPVQAAEVRRTKARMDARTRERLPVLPALAAAVDRAPQGHRRPARRRPRHPARRDIHRRRAGAPPDPHPRSRPPHLGRGPRHRQAPRPDPRGGQTRSGDGPPSKSFATPASASRS